MATKINLSACIKRIIFLLILLSLVLACDNITNSNSGNNSKNSTKITVIFRNNTSTETVSYVNIYTYVDKKEVEIYRKGTYGGTSTTVIDSGKELTLSMEPGNYQIVYTFCYGRIY